MATDTATTNYTRKLPLAPARIWDLLTQAQHRTKWSMPDPSMKLDIVTEDTRAGGIERLRCGPADAPEFEVENRWYDLSSPDRAVFTETLIFGGAPVATSLVTYALTSSETGSELSVTVAASSFSGKETLDEMKAGWDASLENFAAYATEND